VSNTSLEFIVDVIEAIHGRRSIRAYRPSLIERPLIEDVLWAAAQAPTPPVSGETPWAFCAIEGVERIASCGARAKQFARVNQPDGIRWSWPDKPDFKVFWDAPALVLICGRSGNVEMALDCCRAGQNLMLAAHAMGLGTCWVGAPMPWLNSRGIADELGIPAGFVPIFALVLGYPAETPAGNPRPRPDIHWCSNTPLTRRDA
jgi:nitroreductase